MLGMRLAEIAGRLDFWNVLDELDTKTLDWWHAYGGLMGWFPVIESKEQDPDKLMELIKARYG